MPKPLTQATKYGPQPIREILLRKNVAVKQFALSININPIHAVRANRGIVTPAPVYIERASKALGMAPEALFTDAAREAIYLGQIKPNNPADLLLARDWGK